jgi:hypothetical protein
LDRQPGHDSGIPNPAPATPPPPAPVPTQKPRLITRLCTALAFFVGGFLTSYIWLSTERQQVARELEEAKRFQASAEDKYEKDDAVLDKIQSARKKINAALGLPPDEDQPEQ